MRRLPVLFTILAAFLGNTVLAGTINKSVVGELLQTSGWTEVSRDSNTGLVIRQKKLKSLPLTAYLGERPLPAGTDAAKLWRLIADVDSHERFSSKLAESTVIKQSAGAVDFYQVMKPPPFLSSAQRYWFLHTRIEEDVGGVTGHHRRCWSNLPESEATDVRAKVAAQYPSASAVPVTHGCWEVLPATADSPARLRYRTVSDPGGTLARMGVELLTTRTMPENLETFLRAAR